MGTVVWSFLLGFLVVGDILAFIYLGLASYGIIHFLYPFFTYSILRKHHQRMGWVKVSGKSMGSKTFKI